jgi:hypothetical protein
VLPFGNELSNPATLAVDAKDDVFALNSVDQPIELAAGSAAPAVLGPPALVINGVAAGAGRDAFLSLKNSSATDTAPAPRFPRS